MEALIKNYFDLPNANDDSSDDEHEFASNTTAQFSEAPVDGGNIQINITILSITMYTGNTTQHMDVCVNDYNEYVNDGHDEGKCA